MSIFLDFVAATIKAFFLFITFDFVKVTIKSSFHACSTINFVLYVESSTHTFTRPNEITIAYSNNIINLATWKLLEKKGCTFLPVAGYRIGKDYHASTSTSDLYGHQYWSTTANTSNGKDAWALTTFSTSNRLVNRDRYYGHSVRLVKDYVAD